MYINHHNGNSRAHMSNFIGFRHLPLRTFSLLFAALLVISVTACSAPQKISVFEANQVRRTTDETERNLVYIRTLSKECEDNSNEIASLVQQMKDLEKDGQKK
jgi:cytochrome c biogenesis protein ResB